MNKDTQKEEFIRLEQMAKEMAIAENISRENARVQENIRTANMQLQAAIKQREQTKRILEQRRQNYAKKLKAKEKILDKPKMLEEMRDRNTDRFSHDSALIKSLDYAVMAKGQNVKKRERFNSDISHMRTLMTQSYAPVVQSRINQNGFSKEAKKAFEEIKKADMKKQKQVAKAQEKPKKKEKELSR